MVFKKREIQAIYTTLKPSISLEYPSFPEEGKLLNSAFGKVAGLLAAVPHGAVPIAPHTYVHPWPQTPALCGASTATEAQRGHRALTRQRVRQEWSAVGYLTQAHELTPVGCLETIC